MDHRESRLAPDRVVGPDLGERDSVVLAQPTRHVGRPCGNIQIERAADLGEVRPLRHGFEMVDRLGRLHLDDAVVAPAVLRARQHEVWEYGPRHPAYRRGLLLSEVDGHGEAPAPTRLKLADDPIVLELLANGSEEDGGH